MRGNATKNIEQYRVRDGAMASSPEDGRNGAFRIPTPTGMLAVIVSDGSDWAESELPPPAWEHVSVSLAARCPTWSEMDFVKRIFWRDDELVLQFHVPREQHINCHPYCLHLWKPVGVTIPLPPTKAV